MSAAATSMQPVDAETLLRLMKGETVYKTCLRCRFSIRLTRGGVLRSHVRAGGRCDGSRTLRWDRAS